MNDMNDMNDISLDDKDIGISMIYVPMGDDSIKSRDASGNNSRDMIEKRRRRQAKEAVEMLGMMESISDDDESFVQDTLASLEYSTTTAGSSPSFLKDLVETTAPYHMPQWQFFIRKWHRRISQNRNLQRYGPWIVMLLVYASCKMAWQPVGASHRTISAADSMTLKVYQDSVLNQLQPNVAGSDPAALLPAALLNRGVFQPPMAPAFGTNMNHRMQKQQHQVSLAPDNAMDEDPILEQKQLQQRKQYHVETSLKAEEDPMALPPPGPGGTTDPNFQQRFDKLKEISQPDQAAPLNNGQQKQAEPPPQPQQQPQRVDEQQERQQQPPLQQQGTQQQQPPQEQLWQQTTSVQVPPPAADDGTSGWKPRKRGDNRVEPSNLILAGLV
jgi:hypothetical protein